MKCLCCTSRPARWWGIAENGTVLYACRRLEHRTRLRNSLPVWADVMVVGKVRKEY